MLLQELQTSPVLTAASLHLLSCDSDAFDQRELIRYNSELTGSNVESPLLALARRPSDTASPNAAELFVAWRRLNLIWWYCACPSLRSWATDKQQANPLSGIDEAAVQAPDGGHVHVADGDGGILADVDLRGHGREAGGRVVTAATVARAERAVGQRAAAGLDWPAAEERVVAK